MGWRTIVITQRCKLDYSMNYMVIRGEETTRVYIDEISVLLLENNAVSMTGCLLSELMERKIKVVFCDNKKNPQGELVPYYGCHNSLLKIRRQIRWDNDFKDLVWAAVVYEKIKAQAEFLTEIDRMDESRMLKGYLGEIESGDASNREGHAAKVYFNALFGNEFKRRGDDDAINGALNYGYTVIMSLFSREIVANGYITQLGIHHDNQFNSFNLSSDLMEPLRVVVDRKVYNAGYEVFDKDEKHDLLEMLTEKYYVGECEQTLLNAVKIYVKSFFDAMECEDVLKIRFIELNRP